MSRSTSGLVYSQVSNHVPSSRVALGAEVQASGELADDQDVDSGRLRGPEVRPDAELLAEREQALLGPHRLALELGQADRAEQHGVGRPTGDDRLVGQWGALREDRVAAEGVLGVLDAECVEDADRLGCDLGADAVSGEDSDAHAVPCAAS